MTEIQTDVTKGIADFKAVTATLDTDAAKVKVFWADYRTYIVCLACLILGLVIGHAL